MTKNAYIGNVSDSTHRITISVTGDYSRIYNGKATLNGTANGFYIGTDGIALGAYDSTTGNPFQVLPTGALTATSATIKGAVDATSGSFGNGTNKITIGTNGTNDANSAIYSGNKTTFSTAEGGFYIGTDGIALGSYDSISSKNPFQVTTAGVLTATSGTIGGWTLESKRLSSGSNSSYVALDSGTSGSNYAIWAGDSTASSAPFSVTRSGKVTANDVKITGGTLSIGNNFSVTNTGILTAQGANIVTANVSNTLTVGGSSYNGKISVKNSNDLEIVKIDRTGIYFNNINVQTQEGSGSIISSNGIYTNLNFQGINSRPNDNLFGWFKSLQQNAYFPNTISINYEIPENFIIDKAYITLIENPVCWSNVSYDGSRPTWGAAVDVGIFRSENNITIYDFEFLSDVSFGGDDSTIITNVFPGDITYWNADNPLNTSDYSPQIIKTNLLNRNYFSPGSSGVFYITPKRDANDFKEAFNATWTTNTFNDITVGSWGVANWPDYDAFDSRWIKAASLRNCVLQAYLTVYGYTTVT